MDKKDTPAWLENKREYVKGYNKENYYRIGIYIPKRFREYYKKEAEKRGLSLSQLFTVAVDEYIKKDT